MDTRAHALFFHDLAAGLRREMSACDAVIAAAAGVADDDLRARLVQAGSAIGNGVDLSRALCDIAGLSPIAGDLLAEGEETGRVRQRVQQLAYLYAQDTDLDLAASAPFERGGASLERRLMLTQVAVTSAALGLLALAVLGRRRNH